MDDPRPPDPLGLPDALRDAVDHTLSRLGDVPSSAADLPAGIVERAGDLLQDVARRGQDAVDASTAITARVLEAVSETLRRKSHPKVEGE